jgi:hypothetical protein
LAVLVAVAGCSGSGDGSPTQAPHAGDVTSAADLDDPTPGSATVDDTVQDGANADLRDVTLTLDATSLVVRYELAAGMPITGTVLLAVTVFSDDDTVVRQLGTQWINNGTPLVFVYDFEGTEEHLDGVTPVVQGSTITVTYPASVVAGMGASFWWSAVTNVDGADIDRAPDADATEFPE